jgi:hypothetical protein
MKVAQLRKRLNNRVSILKIPTSILGNIFVSSLGNIYFKHIYTYTLLHIHI